MENFIIANKTDVGRARQVNEDNLITFDSPNGRIVAVCDGMGGQAAGDVASELACSIIRDILENNTFASPTEAITKAMVAANQAILHRASQDESLGGMGATCVMLIIKDNIVYYGWVGDSRIYYISNHTIAQISKDQSYVQTLVDSGQITQEEAEHHERKNEITNALGVQGMTPPLLCQMPLKPEPDSVILLCSDGLSGMVDNVSIERVVSKKDISLQERADILINKANENGGLDNITVQLVEFSNTPISYGGTAYGADAVTKQSKKRHTMLYVIIAVVIIAILAVGGYFFFGSKKKDEPKVKVNTPAVSSGSTDTRPNDTSAQENSSTATTKPDKKSHSESVAPAPKSAKKGKNPNPKEKWAKPGTSAKDVLKGSKGNLNGGNSADDIIKRNGEYNPKEMKE